MKNEKKGKQLIYKLLLHIKVMKTNIYKRQSKATFTSPSRRNAPYIPPNIVEKMAYQI